MNNDPIIGQRIFTDKETRSVYWDPQGQYVIDPDGQKVYGVWIFPADEPDPSLVIVGNQ